MSLPGWARDVLRCPACGGSLADGDGPTLACLTPSCRRVYPVRDGVPVLLVDEAIQRP